MISTVILRTRPGTVRGKVQRCSSCGSAWLNGEEPFSRSCPQCGVNTDMPTKKFVFINDAVWFKTTDSGRAR